MIAAATEWISRIETEAAVIYVALAIILLLQLRISSRLRRIEAMIDPKRQRRSDSADPTPVGPADRYMREETLAEFLQRQGKEGR